jgi:hypothetical protein
MRRILVRVGSEWHLLAGDFQGFEEWSTGWLPPPPAGEGPYRGGEVVAGAS